MLAVMVKKIDPNKPDMLELVAIAEKMYEEKPVYELVEFEEELRRRWEKKTGRKLDDKKKTKAGRTEWRNIADWVKATHTRYHETVTFYKDQKEYRVWLNAVGKVGGEHLVPLVHLERVITAMQRLD